MWLGESGCVITTRKRFTYPLHFLAKQQLSHHCKHGALIHSNRVIIIFPSRSRSTQTFRKWSQSQDEMDGVNTLTNCLATTSSYPGHGLILFINSNMLAVSFQLRAKTMLDFNYVFLPIQSILIVSLKRVRKELHQICHLWKRDNVRKKRLAASIIIFSEMNIYVWR